MIEITCTRLLIRNYTHDGAAKSKVIIHNHVSQMRYLAGGEKYYFNRDILNEGYQHSTP